MALHKEGYSTRKIALKTNVSQNAVIRALQRKRETGCNQSRHHSGRPRASNSSVFKVKEIVLKLLLIFAKNLIPSRKHQYLFQL